MSKSYSIEEIQRALALKEVVESMVRIWDETLEVDIDKVHDGRSVEESFADKFLKKYDEIVNQKLAAMERLQELVKHGVYLRLDEDGKVVIALAGKFTNKVFPSCDSVIEAVSCVNMEFAREESNES